MTDTKKDGGPAHPACEDCRYWDKRTSKKPVSTQLRDAQPDTTGMCRVEPPRLNKMTGAALWPFTEDVDWCGRFFACEREQETE